MRDASVAFVRMDASGSRKRQAAGVAVAIVAFVVALVAAASLLTVDQDIAPAGDSCIVDTSTTSGAAGVEEVRWSPLPTRTCVVDGEDLGDGGSGLVTLAVAFVFASAAAAVACSVVDRAWRRADDDRVSA